MLFIFRRSALSVSDAPFSAPWCARILCLAILVGGLVPTTSRAAPPSCSLPGVTRIIFDSNRSGSFGIHSVLSDGSDLRTIVDTAEDEVHPDVSPDGQWLVFERRAARARGKRKGGGSSIWIVSLGGGISRKLNSDGAFPTFDSTGKRVTFERRRAKAMSVAIDGSGERELFPADASFRHEIVMPRLSPDGHSVAFTSDRDGRWNSWIADLRTKKLQRIGRGCEPVWSSDGESVVWVSAGKSRGGSGIFRFERARGAVATVHDDDAPWGHEYFPSLAKEGSLLLYAAAPPGQHDHDTSNYQIFVRDIAAGCTQRVTHDRFTNRWPKLVPAALPSSSSATTDASASAP